jgi:hypothetical protein
MKFHEKLNLLMNLQNIPNNKLAKALSVDPSLISRWRNGTRDLTKHSEYVTGIATYFASQTCNKERLIEILDISKSEHIDHAFLTDKIWHWLSDDILPNTSLVNQFIARFNQVKASNLPPFKPESLQNSVSGKSLNVEVFYGNEGKRQSVINFLTTIIKQNKIVSLKLYSDDSMDWMLEDPDFCIEWKQLLSEVIRRGNRIIIIHTINRETDEMNAAIDRWLPLYMTGAVEPYYYPSHQDTPFKHTLFLAPDIVGVTTTAMAINTVSEQLLYRDPTMLANLESTFDAYLEHCRPLMKVYKMKEIDKFQTLYREFETQTGNMSLLSKSPSLTTMPPEIFHDVLNPLSNGSNEEKLNMRRAIEHYNNRTDTFRESILTNKHCEWLHLPEINQLIDKSFSYNGPLDWFVSPKPTFESKHYVHHVANVLQLMHLHKTYTVHLTPLSIPDDLFIAFKQDIGVIICKVDQSPIFIALNHMKMVNAFENFIEAFSENACSDVHTRAVTIKTIETWLEQAKSALEL